jgi:hypothetical protein
MRCLQLATPRSVAAARTVASEQAFCRLREAQPLQHELFPRPGLESYASLDIRECACDRHVLVAAGVRSDG